MSMKKSLFLLVAVIAAVTIFSIASNGDNTMNIQMDSDGISFSGIDDFNHRLLYADIAEVSLEIVPDWDYYGGHEFGHFRIGTVISPGSIPHSIFVTRQIDTAIIATLHDGSQMIFNYNNESGTKGVYEMLLENLK